MTDVSSFYQHILNPGGGLFTGAPPVSSERYPRDQGQVYGYNARTGDYEIRRPGEAYSVSTLPANMDFSIPTGRPQTAVAAIEQAAPAVPAPQVLASPALALAPPAQRPAQANRPALVAPIPAARPSRAPARQNLLDLLTGPASPLAPLFDKLGSGSSAATRAPSSWFSLTSSGGSGEGGIEGNGGITGYY